jgi:hypothetical protein
MHVPQGTWLQASHRSPVSRSVLPMKHLLLPFVIITAVCTTAFGQVKVEFQDNDTMSAVLKRQVGQVVDLRMESGEKMGGKVEKVTDKLVHLSQLTGAEFYDAVVDIEAIAAVSVRTKGK